MLAELRRIPATSGNDLHSPLGSALQMEGQLHLDKAALSNDPEDLISTEHLLLSVGGSDAFHRQGIS